MCGIGAIIHGDVAQIERLMLPIKSRGELDCFNEHSVVGDCAFSCNRLKIVGRQSGRQPLYNKERTLLAVFNGEIYNFRELREELKQLGYVFQTESDTEALVHGYDAWGKKLPTRLDGQFAFIIYDKSADVYFAARDHFGIKPLFWAKSGSTIYFGSELKQLIPFVSTVHEVLPGHYVHKNRQTKYYRLKYKDNKQTEEQAVEKIRFLFDQAVKKRCLTDLPIAVFLSGGVDSTAIIATARKYHNKVAAIVVGNDWDSEDSDYSVAVHYCKLNDIPIVACSPPTEKKLFEQIPKIVEITESFEPNMIKQAGLSLFLSDLAKQHGFKVVLCGEGADELFCGYPEFTQTPPQLINELSFDFLTSLYKTQLQRVDRTSLFHTVEVRVPFLDKQLVEYVSNLPASLKVKDDVTKYILRMAVGDRLPENIAWRKKVVLSEGMGLKGNSLNNGLFSEVISENVDQNVLSVSNSLAEEYSLKNLEEKYYFQFYSQLRYTKLIHVKRTTVNKVNSINCVDDVLSVFQKSNYCRDIPANIRAAIEVAVGQNNPIKFVGFWGVGNKAHIDSYDEDVIVHLCNFIDDVSNVYPPGIAFTFIISDKHAEMNAISSLVSSQYISEITPLLESRSFSSELLSDLWAKYDLSIKQAKLLLSKKSDRWWPAVTFTDVLLKNAKRIHGDSNALQAAQLYYVVRECEKTMLEQEFPGSIFQTYSDSTIAEILPSMPTFYMRATANWLNVPWFNDL